MKALVAIRKAIKRLRETNLEPKFGETLHWYDKDGWHSKYWGHKARIDYHKKLQGNSAKEKP